MTYDTKCFDLAKVFLEDHPHLDTAKNVELLAQQIQDIIEAELKFLEEQWQAVGKDGTDAIV